ncbi:hypothetical protein N7520_010700 [Penicillium odoratum]|uniref:uncharacterized protein n=1 Tax=Penicillium odoratum TaxID=1167516 RepID=UPI002546D1B9|nr:uncharacterized protein N7520_010700 [Penicillium odoratum]KAJ5745518.1 hypothetical protein N7520_010700 [Penicillium odoratum]
MKNGTELAVSQKMRSPLLDLPNEILQIIASLLPHDCDVVRFALACKETKTRILGREGPNAEFWRTRFVQKYDVPKERTSYELLMEYQTRSIVLRQEIDFQQNNFAQQDLWLQVIQTMLYEVLSLPLQIGTMSKTYERIREAIRCSRFLSRPKVKRRKYSEHFCAIQLCLTALSLDSTVSPAGYRTDYNIDVVYSYTIEPNGPFIGHENLNLTGLLQMRNFWTRHLLSSAEGTFYNSFSNLADDLKPKGRKMDGSKSTHLSHSWIGYYSCLHPIPSTLEELQRRQTCADLDTHWDQVDILSLEIESQSDEGYWPSEFDVLIPRLEGPGIKRFYFAGHQNTLGASIGAANPMFGFMEPIETHYGGFPGWSRICFVIYEKLECHEQITGLLALSRWVHGYEAVVIPGGRIMLGWWMDMKNISGRGPFIFWDV